MESLQHRGLLEARWTKFISKSPKAPQMLSVAFGVSTVEKGIAESVDRRKILPLKKVGPFAAFLE